MKARRSRRSDPGPDGFANSPNFIRWLEGCTGTHAITRRSAFKEIISKHWAAY